MTPAADDVGPWLKWATAKIAVVSRDKVPHAAKEAGPWDRQPADAASWDGDQPPF